ncbi:Short-chain dehydrogenase/reductase-like protein YusS [Fusarium oxysporum f. sp. rapae]|uniref:Short-chain dehydrogenase/reductase-like protein YusS n=1 Tax=Fusarium oxysporum f. sp. rapae TaxID=485398 RepID=A0A8J5NKC5_FUSOX|nr:Short-chain dehydrogenase/reductase-like protein YusS [Fusarium oxysporum f. sp. rapae]
MAAKFPIVLILGSGPNIGQSVARKFASEGYKVAIASRSQKEADSTDKQLNIKTDLTKPLEVADAFSKVKATFGTPSIVVYNASAAAFPPADDPLSVSYTDFSNNTAINIHSAFIAAQQAVAGFAQLPDTAARTFIYTGNILNVTILPKFLDAGVGKSGAAHMMWAAADAYKNKGYKFYYADERKPDGAPKYRVDGDAHADLYWELSQGKEQGPWMQTFVKGEGYKKFDTLYTPIA